MANETKYPPGAGLSGYSKERAQGELGALEREKLGAERRLQVAQDEQLPTAMHERQIKEIDAQIKVFEKFISTAPSEGSA